MVRKAFARVVVCLKVLEIFSTSSEWEEVAVVNNLAPKRASLSFMLSKPLWKTYTMEKFPKLLSIVKESVQSVMELEAKLVL
jgi:hypothetical protein